MSHRSETDHFGVLNQAIEKQSDSFAAFLCKGQLKSYVGAPKQPNIVLTSTPFRAGLELG